MIVEGYPKTRKIMFWIWLRPTRYKIPEPFTIAPVLTSTLTICRRNRGDPSSLQNLGCFTIITEKNSRFGLAWCCHAPIAVLCRPSSVSHTTIGICEILSRSVDIWQYEGQNMFLSKNTARPSISSVIEM